MDIYVDEQIIPAGNPVIKVNGVCYEFVEDSTLAPDTIAIDGTFDTCEECEASPSPSPVPSVSPSPSPVPSVSPSPSPVPSVSPSPSPVPSPSPSPSPSAPAALCVGTNCAGGTQGSMQLKVYGTSGTIDWCGEQWVLPGDSGDPRCVCPPNWDQQKGGPTTSQYAYHRWSYNASAYNRLRLLRRVNLNTFQDYGVNQLALGVAGYGSFSFSDFVTFQTQVTGFTSILLGFIAPPTPAAPTISDYQITDEFFGQYTHANGITYEWQKGDNW
jgi:hypothetical protein